MFEYYLKIHLLHPLTPNPKVIPLCTTVMFRDTFCPPMLAVATREAAKMSWNSTLPFRFLFLTHMAGCCQHGSSSISSWSLLLRIWQLIVSQVGHAVLEQATRSLPSLLASAATSGITSHVVTRGGHGSGCPVTPA